MARRHITREFKLEAVRLVRNRIELRFGFIAKHRGIWPMRWMCEVLDVSPSGFYSWVGRPLSR